MKFFLTDVAGHDNCSVSSGSLQWIIRFKQRPFRLPATRLGRVSMSVRSNVVLQHVAVENQHDMEAMLATLDVESPVRDEVAGKCYEGVEAVKQRYTELWTAFPDFRVFPRQLIEEGNTIVMLADYSGTHRGQYGDAAPTGKSFNVRIANFIDFNGDKIVRETIFMDLASQSRQLGLSVRR